MDASCDLLDVSYLSYIVYRIFIVSYLTREIYIVKRRSLC